ncbi:hypothetical protein BC834DRAFT_1028256 [Gloeopeniophorella convolvens]|nr:hypothetical protein BC834DRAFT_1028256 [Gloeopeniophorella convolvens]
MANDPQGSAKNLSGSRAEALQALVSSLAPDGASSADAISKEDVTKLSEKLEQLLDGADLPQGTERRNEQGQLLNEEGLPIVEISEPMESASGPARSANASANAANATSSVSTAVDQEDPGFTPMYHLPPALRERNRERMDHILDLLEEEERVEEERLEARERQQRQEELEQRKENVRAELERIKAAKEMQKRMGKALLKNMAEVRDREEKDKEQQEQEDLRRESERKSRKPRKSVSWAELPKSDRAPTSPHEGDSPTENVPGSSDRQTMKYNIVERFPSRSGAPPSLPLPEGDSDDESNPPSPAPTDSDEGEATHSDRAESPGLGYVPSDDEDEDEPAEEPLSDADFDIDATQHQREIALAYFEKRNAIGADAARAMSAHSHELAGEDEWDQEEVPLEATLSRPHPKPAQSRFKNGRIAQAYSTRVPSAAPSTSLGASVVPGSAGAIRRTVRTGRLEGGQLVGGESESDPEDEDARVRAFMDALRRGEVTNAGVAGNSDVLVAALESAYGAPRSAPTAPPSSSAAGPSAPSEPPKSTAPKVSKFKLARAPPRAPGADGSSREGTPVDVAPRSSPKLPTPKLPTSDTVLERKPPAVIDSPSFARPQAAPAEPSSFVPPPMIVDSPSFAPPPMIIDSPSFAPPGGTPSVIDSPSFRPTAPSSTSRHPQPPTVLASSVRERGATSQQAPVPEPAKKVSRFMTQRAGS